MFPAQFSALLQRVEFSDSHLAYISLLIDSYEFTSTCLERQIEDVNSLENGFVIKDFDKSGTIAKLS